jgi:hypothetical protein
VRLTRWGVLYEGSKVWVLRSYLTTACLSWGVIRRLIEVEYRMVVCGQPQERPGGRSVHQQLQPHELHVEPRGGLSGPGEHDGHSFGITHSPGVTLSSS